MAFGDFLFGKKAGIEFAPSPYTQQQQGGMNQSLMQALQGLQQTPFNFGPIRQNALNTFNQDIIPTLAERFAGLGALNSSGFTGELGRAGTGLASQLASQEQQYNLAQQGNLMNLLNIGLQPQRAQYQTEGEQGLLPGVLSTFFGGATGGLGKLLPLLGLFGGRQNLLSSLGQNQQQFGGRY